MQTHVYQEYDRGKDEYLEREVTLTCPDGLAAPTPSLSFHDTGTSKFAIFILKDVKEADEVDAGRK
jgi:hypothetical protein